MVDVPTLNRQILQPQIAVPVATESQDNKGKQTPLWDHAERQIPYQLLHESTRSTSLYTSLMRTISEVGTAPSISLVRS
jgi:hypothetical protein